MSAADVGAISALFARTFGSGKAGPPGNLERAISDLYLPRPEYDDLVSSLVSYDEDGQLNGFIGAFPMPFVIDGKSYVAAVCGGLMVDPARAGGLVGPRLLRSIIKGPQDLSISDTANAISEAMWRRLNGSVLPDYSLEWIRVFRPFSFAGSLFAQRAPRPFRALGHRTITRPLDAVGRKFLSSLDALEASPCEEKEVDGDDEFAAYLEQVTGHFAGRPDWQRIDLSKMVSKAKDKPLFGDVTRRVVFRAGKPIGVYHFHAKPFAIGRVLQIAAIAGAEQMVVDRLFLTACRQGLAGLLGRTQPALLDAMLTRKCLFFHKSSTVVHAGETSILAPFLRGHVFLNGFAGEGWTAFNGGRL